MFLVVAAERRDVLLLLLLLLAVHKKFTCHGNNINSKIFGAKLLPKMSAIARQTWRNRSAQARREIARVKRGEWSSTCASRISRPCAGCHVHWKAARRRRVVSLCARCMYGVCVWRRNGDDIAAQTRTASATVAAAAAMSVAQST